MGVDGWSPLYSLYIESGYFYTNINNYLYSITRILVPVAFFVSFKME